MEIFGFPEYIYSFERTVQYLKFIRSHIQLARIIIMLIKIQPDITVYRYIFIYCKVTLHVSCITAPIIRSTKNCNRSLRYRS